MAHFVGTVDRSSAEVTCLWRVARAFDLAGITNPVGVVHAKIVEGGR